MTNIVPVQSDLLEQRVRIDLRILNPNDAPLPLDGMDFRLDLNGARLARGVSNTAITVPRLGEVTTSIVASTSAFDLFRQMYVMATRQDGAVEYRIAGRAFVDRSAPDAIKGLPARLAFEKADTLRLDSLINRDRPAMVHPILTSP